MLKHLFKILSVFSLGFLSCTEDAIPPNIATYYVHPELVEYLDRFMDEAALRNIEVDTAGINLELVNEPLTLDGSAACGLAHVFGTTFPNVRISQTCWDLFNAEHRETLMFHELGHALLDRPHFDADLPVGTAVSMMNSSSSRVYNKFTLFKRDYYIDELFGLNPEVPYWGEAKTQTDTLFFYGVSEAAQPWTVQADFIDGAGATRNIVTDEDNNYAYRVSIPDQAIGSSMRLTITMLKDQLPRAGASVDFAVDFKFASFSGPTPRLLTSAMLSSIEMIHGASTQSEILINHTDQKYVTYVLPAIDYYVDEANFINVEIIISAESTGTIWFDNFTIIERY